MKNHVATISLAIVAFGTSWLVACGGDTNSGPCVENAMLAPVGSTCCDGLVLDKGICEPPGSCTLRGDACGLSSECCSGQCRQDAGETMMGACQ
jgi:hypothetical protein